MSIWNKKNGKSIEQHLKVIQLNFYAIVFLLGFILVVIIQIISVLTSDALLTNKYSASNAIRSEYQNIDTYDISKNGGSAQIVTKDLHVTTLTGEGIISEKQLTIAKWSEYLLLIGKTQVSAGKYNATVAYEDKSQFWLIVSFPASFEVQVSVMSNRQSTNFLSEIFILSIIVSIYILIVVFVTIRFSKYSAKRFVKPIKSLQKYTVSLEEGDYTNRMDECLEGEYGELQSTFYHLAEELEKKTEENKRIVENKNEMILDISHDLKNPLTAVQGYAEVLLLKKELDSVKQDAYLSAIYQNSHRANEILSSLFSYAQLESKDFILHKERTDFSEFIRLCILDSMDEIEIADMKLDCCIPDEEYWMEFDLEQMKRVIFNLLGNAVKYNKPGTNIFIKVYKEERNIRLEISDNGCGINQEKESDIFNPFIREDKARNSKTGGSGLGLAIVKKIVEAHGGTVVLLTGVGKGCKFTISLPERI